jgi:hypothetical protein
MMNKNVSARGSFDKAIAFGVIKPLNLPSFLFHFHGNLLLLLPLLHFDARCLAPDGEMKKPPCLLAAVTGSGQGLYY